MPYISPATTPYYGGGQVANPANVIYVDGQPPSTYLQQNLGTVAIDNSSGAAWILISKENNVAVWQSFAGGTNTYPITPFVVGPLHQAGYQTIQSALDAAGATGSAQAIYVQPGTYTENLIFPDVNITLFGDRGSDATINGVHTPSASANLELHQFLLISSTDIFSSTAAGTSNIEISECFIIITDGYVFNLENWTGELLMDDSGEASTADGVVYNTGGCTIKFLNTEMGAGTSNVMTLTGNANVRFDTCNINCPVNVAGSGTYVSQNGCVFRNTLTIGGSKTATIIQSDFIPSTGAALTYNSSGAGYIDLASINTSNDPAISGSGAGTLTIGTLSFIDGAVISDDLTLTYGTLITGALNPQGITTLLGGAQILSGTGAPSISAPKGSLYLRLDGSSSTTRAYINTNSSTSWTAVETAG